MVGVHACFWREIERDCLLSCVTCAMCILDGSQPQRPPHVCGSSLNCATPCGLLQSGVACSPATAKAYRLDVWTLRVQAIPKLPEPRWAAGLPHSALRSTSLPTCLPACLACPFSLICPPRPVASAGTRLPWPCWAMVVCMSLVACCLTAPRRHVSTGA